MAQPTTDRDTPSGLLQAWTTFSTSWQKRKAQTPMYLRLGMSFSELLATSSAMAVLAGLIHIVVQNIDETYEIIGRRARSPYAPSNSVLSLITASLLLFVWHVWLGRLSYSAIMEQDVDESGNEKGETTRRISWGRVLGRIVVPMLLLSLGVHFAFQLAQRLITPTPFVTSNVNDAKEIEMELKSII
ncbi:hypothetical protein EK21DRAFT_75926 [Setomelanomma holmii]|uniref:Uncharacterized protein n=1 Tax=Setomelanomma holmii TaxID=210430 RepID=A0A9P4H0M8_9PLEO|nr:hypothetical protein EK21DRAFT_75926 [Setomelanomma holmii]